RSRTALRGGACRGFAALIQRRAELLCRNTEQQSAMNTNLALLALSDAAKQSAVGPVPPVALTAACLDRPRTWHASRNCFIRIDGDAALETALKRDRELKRDQRRGALHGVPLAHKDMFYRAGKVSRGGSRILQGQIATTTA